MKKNKSIQAVTLAIISTMFIMASCEEELIGPEKANTPTNNFEHFWTTFDTHYGLFDVKNINWNNIHDQFRPSVTDEMTDAALYQVLSDMIVLLNDNHLNLYPTNGELPVFPGGVMIYRNGKLNILKVQEDYDLDVVKQYVTDFNEATPNITHGRLPGNLAYINIKGTDGLKEVKKQMDKVLGEIGDASGVVVDVRGFNGGFDPVSQYLAGCFASSRQLYMTTRKRNGPLHSDFTAPVQWYVTPESGSPYTKPVILLTSRFTQSAGETFVMAMKQFQHVKTLGDTTAGSLSDNPNFEMANGWIFSVSVGDYRAADGTSYEGIGIAPDEFLKNSKEDLLNVRDMALERAMALLK